MRVNIIYQSGTTAYELLDKLKMMGCTMVCSEVTISGEKYVDIELQDHGKLRRVMNAPSAIVRLDDQVSLSGMLWINKIAFGLIDGETINRVYEVFVFDLEILYIKMRSPDREKSKYVKQADHSRIAETASRALILSGLDFASITIALTSRRRLKVMEINPSPVLRERDLSRMVGRIMTIHEAQEHNIKLGADPEFMLVNTRNGKMVAASRFFPRDGEVGCDHIRIPNRQQRPIAELRPAPERYPGDLVINIKQALENAAVMAPFRNVKWVAGSQPYPGYSIGGHVHFSNIKVNAALLRALDNYLGIPIFLIENPVTAARRRKRYGLLGEYRLKDYGGFEYRTPGSWLISKEITTATLVLAKLIADNYSLLRKNYLNNEAAQRAFYAGDQEYFRSIFPAVWSDIKTLEDYQSCASDLDVIPRMVANQVTWDEKADIRKVWKLHPNRSKREKRRMDSSEQPNPNRNIARDDTETRAGGRRATTFSASTDHRTRGRISTPSARRSVHIPRSSYHVNARTSDNTSSTGTVTSSHQVRRARPIR